MGLLILRKLLLIYFSDGITSLVLFAVFFGSNLFYYATIEGPMAHAFDFALIALFMHLTIKWYAMSRDRA